MVISAQAFFARPVMVERDVELRVDVLQAGRTFATATTSLWQDDKERARALVLLSAEEPDLIRHGSTPPDVPPPEEVAPIVSEHVRVVGGVDIQDADSVGEPSLQLWARHPDAGDDLAVGQGLLAHTSATMLIGTAMRPHPGVGQSAAHAAFSTGIIGHAISFHEPFDATNWMLLAHTSTYAGRGRAYGTGEVFQDSRLIASYSQESMIRHFPEGVSPAGQESTIL